MAKKVFQEDNSINSLDDIVFEFRNKDYGVYQLRKRYKRHLLSGFLIAFLIFGGAVAYPIIEAYSLKYRVVRHVPQSGEIVFDSFDEPDMPPPPLPSPPVAFENQVRFRAPVIVDSVQDDEGIVASIDEQRGFVENGIPPEQIEAAPQQDKGPIIEDDGPGMVIVEENATFQGGDVNSFRIWVQQNVVYPTAAIEVGLSGRVIVQFAVNSRGEVVDVKILRGVHPELDREVVRCILSSPRWVPGKQGDNSHVQ